MFTKFFFNRMSPEDKMAYLRKKGTFIGNRTRNTSLVSLYMLSDSFVEIVFKKDNPNELEEIKIFSNLESLNGYLEDDARLSIG
ncbi:MAG: hypothetical protein OEU76_04575 [Cyclobacteriaceae bacterium]|nr:hypothetical protein [Cyclobacteriaceae bacterium]